MAEQIKAEVWPKEWNDWDPSNDEQIKPYERFWRDHQRWLQEKGYMLRPRFRPEWIPSWKGTKKQPYDCEDGRSIAVCCLFTFVDLFQRLSKSAQT